MHGFRSRSMVEIQRKRDFDMDNGMREGHHPNQNRRVVSRNCAVVLRLKSSALAALAHILEMLSDRPLKIYVLFAGRKLIKV